MTPSKILADIVEKVCLNDIRGSRAAHAEAFFASVSADADRTRAAIEFSFSKLYDSIKGTVSKSGSGSVKVFRKRASIKPLGAKQIKDIAGDLRRKIILSEFVLPDGTNILEATREQCIAAGGWLHDLGLSLKPNQKVGSRHTEETLQRLFQRQH